MFKTALIYSALAIAATPAHAHARHHHHVRHYAHRHHHTHLPGWRTHRVYDRGEIVAHPAGCPRVAFCGCGSALEIFGRPIRELWLAANWLRFPRTSPHPGAAVVFGRHHVAVIRQVYGDGTVLLYDPNSGRLLTRVHRMSIARGVVVEPRRL